MSDDGGCRRSYQVKYKYSPKNRIDHNKPTNLSQEYAKARRLKFRRVSGDETGLRHQKSASRKAYVHNGRRMAAVLRNLHPKKVVLRPKRSE